MVIKILGSCCKNCEILFDNTKAVLNDMNIEAEVVKVSDFKEIMAYGVMKTPTLVIDEEVVSVGKTLKPKEISQILEKLKYRQ